MRIAHISDLHISAEGDTFGLAPMAENLARVVAHLIEISPDIVLISGDITNEAKLVEAARAAEILARLGMPFLVVPGNHDDRSVLWAIFGGGAIPTREPDHLSYVYEAGEYRIIALDSTDSGAPNGRFCASRAAWLETELAKKPVQPTLLFLHHPPMKCAVQESDCPPLEGADLLGKVVENHPQIERILCGHIHLPVQALWKGRLVCTAPSLGMRLRWQPDQNTESAFFVSAPSYLLHMLNADGALISHQISLDDPAGPFDFE